MPIRMETLMSVAIINVDFFYYNLVFKYRKSQKNDRNVKTMRNFGKPIDKSLS